MAGAGPGGPLREAAGPGGPLREAAGPGGPLREAAGPGTGARFGRQRRMRLAVNPITCEGHGLCAELLPEWIRLDDWGYPIVNPDPVPPELKDHARRAVAACPTLALLVRLD